MRLPEIKKQNSGCSFFITVAKVLSFKEEFMFNFFCGAAYYYILLSALFVIPEQKQTGEKRNDRLCRVCF